MSLSTDNPAGLRKAVVMPDAEEMMRRMSAVEDNKHLVKYLYPEIVKDAGRKYAAPGIVNMLVFAMDDFIETGYSIVMEIPIKLNIPLWIDALVDNKEVAEAAKQFFSEMLSQA